MTRSITVIAFLLAAILTTNGINVEHHCRHCHQQEKAACCHDHGMCQHCDHCANCFFMHLSLDQYDQAQHTEVPTPEMLTMFGFLPEVETVQEFVDFACPNILLAHAPPLPGRRILCAISKLSL